MTMLTYGGRVELTDAITGLGLRGAHAAIEHVGRALEDVELHFNDRQRCARRVEVARRPRHPGLERGRLARLRLEPRVTGATLLLERRDALGGLRGSVAGLRGTARLFRLEVGDP